MTTGPTTFGAGGGGGGTLIAGTLDRTRSANWGARAFGASTGSDLGTVGGTTLAGAGVLTFGAATVSDLDTLVPTLGGTGFGASTDSHPSGICGVVAGAARPTSAIDVSGATSCGSVGTSPVGPGTCGGDGVGGGSGGGLASTAVPPPPAQSATKPTTTATRTPARRRHSPGTTTTTSV